MINDNLIMQKNNYVEYICVKFYKNKKKKQKKR